MPPDVPDVPSDVPAHLELAHQLPYMGDVPTIMVRLLGSIYIDLTHRSNDGLLSESYAMINRRTRVGSSVGG